MLQLPRLKVMLPVLVALLSSLAGAQVLPVTKVQDVLFNADGTKTQGSAKIIWKAFTASNGSPVAANELTTPIVDGVFSVDLTPNDTAVPPGTSYKVVYTLDTAIEFSETWIVPESATPVTIPDVRVGSAPIPGTVILLSQVSGLGAALDLKADLNEPNLFTDSQTIRQEASGTIPPLAFESNDGLNSIDFFLPPLSVSTSYRWPNADGLPNQQLTTDGTGSLFWSAAGSGAAVSSYEIFQDDGAAVTQRNVANFSNGLQAFDNAGSTRTEVQPLFGATAGTITEGNDVRLSDARAPAPHNPMLGTDPAQTVFLIQAAPGQTANLQEWRDGTGALLSLVTVNGASFFREMGIAARLGETVATQFFEQDSKKRVAWSAFEGVFNLVRCDDTGAFKDNAMQIERSGVTKIHNSLDVDDTLFGTGTIGLTGNYINFEEVPVPIVPASTNARIFVNSADGELSIVKDSGAVVSLEDNAPGFHDSETPAGAIDGVNPSFTLAVAPSPVAALQLSRNGLLQAASVDYSLSGTTITFLTASIPQSGDSLSASYRE